MWLLIRLGSLCARMPKVWVEATTGPSPRDCRSRKRSRPRATPSQQGGTLSSCSTNYKVTRPRWSRRDNGPCGGWRRSTRGTPCRPLYDGEKAAAQGRDGRRLEAEYPALYGQFAGRRNPDRRGRRPRGARLLQGHRSLTIDEAEDVRSGGNSGVGSSAPTAVTRTMASPPHGGRVGRGRVRSSRAVMARMKRLRFRGRRGRFRVVLAVELVEVNLVVFAHAERVFQVQSKEPTGRPGGTLCRR